MTDGDDGSGSSWSSGNSLPDLVAGLYYRYGLFVATHPAKFILLTITSFALLSTPLWYLPFPGYLPQDYVTSIQNYSVPPPAPEGGLQLSPSPTPTPLWYQGPPRAYIQQVVVRSAVTPWHEGITVGESLRGPLDSVFRLSQVIADFQLKNNRSVTLGSECLLVEGVVRGVEAREATEGGPKGGPRLPHFNCLVLSPADLWGRDREAFRADHDVLRTVESLKAKHEEETSIADILFGLPSPDVGLSPAPTHPHVLSYAITLALKHYSETFVFGLEEELARLFPVHQPTAPPPRQSIVHVYFPSRISVWEFLILIFYGFLFCSICFSVLKMQGLYSKLGLAFSVMAALVASLCIAASVSAHFGLRPLHSKGKYLYPVLAALVGFENSMALVRTVLATPDHLDVKIRVAQGLAREGWTITKYFLSMITVVTVSFFLFIPLVQEICIYGSLVLLCDLYLQLLFITAVIAVDLHRSQNAEPHNRGATHVNPLFRYPTTLSSQSGGGGGGGVRLISQDHRHRRQGSDHATCVPNLHRRHAPAARGQDRLAPPQSKPQPAEHIPRRLRLTYFVARKRMFQRMFMCGFVAWIVWIIYTSELVTHLTDPMHQQPYPRDLASVIFSLTNRSSASPSPSNTSSSAAGAGTDSGAAPPTLSNATTAHRKARPPHVGPGGRADNDRNRSELNLLQLKHTRRSFARRLPISHWPVLFSYYNISLRGHYLSILPPILLSVPISPEEAKAASNSHDPHSKEWVPQPLGAEVASNYENWQEESAIVPSSRGELFLTAVLVIPAVAVLVYATIALYRCVCSRNYAEWRSSKWGHDHFKDETAQIIGEAVPLVLCGHRHDVECLSSDGPVVVSSCLAGVICAWDSGNGERIALIDRRRTTYGRRSAGPADAEECHCAALREYAPASRPSASADQSSRKKSSESSTSGGGGVGVRREKGRPTVGRECPPDSPLLPQSHSFPSLPSSSSPPPSPPTEALSWPDLTPTIDLSFRSASPPSPSPSSPSSPSPFAHIQHAYDDHFRLHHRAAPPRRDFILPSPGKGEGGAGAPSPFEQQQQQQQQQQHQQHRCSSTRRKRSTRHLSDGSIPPRSPTTCPSSSSSSSSSSEGAPQCSPIWCLEYLDGLVYVGTGTGCLEVWDVFAAALKGSHDDGSGVGITSLALSSNRVVAARLSGCVDILVVGDDPTHNQRQQHSPYKGRYSSSSSQGVEREEEGEEEEEEEVEGGEDLIEVSRLSLVKAHQQPITVLTCDNSRVITGSQDHTLKVLNLFDGSVLFTLHGHCGPVTSVCLGGPLKEEEEEEGGTFPPSPWVGIPVDLVGVGAVIASGAQDGGLCVWDCYTGACVYSVDAHDGPLLALTCTDSYILSLGADEKMRVWERFQGHLLNTLVMTQMYCSTMVMLTNRLLITSQQGSLTVWDITAGAPVRVVRLGDRDSSVFVRHLLPVAGGSIVCDYGPQLRVVRLLLAHKTD